MKSKYKRITIFGASGFLGKNIIEHHLEDPVTELVTAVFRKKPKNYLTHPKLKVVVLTSQTIEEFVSIIESSDLLVNATGQLGSWQTTMQSYLNANVIFVKKLIHAFNKSNARLFVHLSSASVVGVVPEKSMPADESWPFNPQHSYEYSKSAAEIIISELAEKQYLILRPEFVYGRWDVHVLRLFEAIKKNLFFIVGNGETILHPTHIDDVIKGYQLAVETCESSDTYFIAGPQPVTINELRDTIQTVFGGSSKMSLPIRFIEYIARSNEWLSSQLGLPNFLNRAQLDFFTQNRFFSTKKANRELGYNPKISYEDGLRKTKQWYKKEGWL